MSRRTIFALLVCLSQTTCSGCSRLNPCDPFAPKPKPITLGTVIAAGRDSAGVIYVVASSDPRRATPRVFVSENGVLVRRRIAGGGSTGTLQKFLLDDLDPDLTLLIDTPYSGPMRMGVAHGRLTESRTYDVGVQGEDLALLDASKVSGLPVRNLPGDIHLEYAATLPDGRVIVVTRPLYDSRYEDFRLFLGPLDHVAEYKVTNVLRMKDGGSTTVGFDLGVSRAEAKFPVRFADGTASLEVGGRRIALVRQRVKPANAAYLCTHP